MRYTSAINLLWYTVVMTCPGKLPLKSAQISSLVRTDFYRDVRCIVAAVLFVIVSGCGGNSTSPKKRIPSAEKTAGSDDHRKRLGDLTGSSGSNGTSRPNRGPEPVPTPVITKPKPQPVFRPSDDRPKHDDAKLAKLGIRKYVSKRLILYTDLDPAIAKTLPTIIDQAYPAWVKYFGQLPPTRERTPFQLTGYVIKDKALFQRAKLIPRDLPPFVNGRHRGYEFWMYDSPWDYYRRHLLIHEATHCFMYATRSSLFPNWYMEGMAEFFGTHAIDKNGTVTFGVMPQRQRDYKGFGRIEYVQVDCRAGSPLSLKEVVFLMPNDYLQNQAYAWSWALCKFFDSHPRYRYRFRELRRIESATAFRRAFRKLVLEESPHISAEWLLFATGLVYGYDAKNSAIEIRPGKPLVGVPRSFELQTNRGWQSSGIWLDKGEAVDISAAGRFELAQKPKPWICEPQGVSITWFQGRPLGEVTAVIVPDSKRSLPFTAKTLRPIPIGRHARLKAPIKGTLYLRVNDSFAWLADNKGTVKIAVSRAVAPRQ